MRRINTLFPKMFWNKFTFSCLNFTCKLFVFKYFDFFIVPFQELDDRIIVVYGRFDGCTITVSVKTSLFDYSRINVCELFTIPFSIFSRAGGCEPTHTKLVREYVMFLLRLQSWSTRGTYSPMILVWFYLPLFS